MTTFPIEGGEILSTFMQFHSESVENGGGRDRFDIRLNDGLDIAAKAGDKVKTIRAGIVLAAHLDDIPHKSFVVIQDDHEDGTAQNGGWNYVHVIPGEEAVEGRRLKEGTQIGTVAEFPKGQTTHLHVSRGKGALTELPGLPDSSLKPLIHELEKGNENEKRRANALKKFLAPYANPLPELEEAVVDKVKPEIFSLGFRLAEDDKLGAIPKSGKKLDFGDRGETLGQFQRYFTEEITIGKKTYQHIGRYAKATSLDKKSSVDDERNTKVDLVVHAGDRIGTEEKPGRYALNPLNFKLRISQQQLSDKGEVFSEFDSFNFQYHGNGMADFYSRELARSVHSLDSRYPTGLRENHLRDNKSTSNGPFITISNSRNVLYSRKDAADFDPAVDRIRRGPLAIRPKAEDIGIYWNSLAAKDADHFASFTDQRHSAQNAKRNAEAAYPDGVYEFHITAFDAHGNAGHKAFPVILTNWRRTVEFANPAPAQKVGQGNAPQVQRTVVERGSPIQISGGEGYLANQSLNAYLRPIVDNTQPFNNLKLNPISLGQIETDADGRLKAIDKKTAGVNTGKYYLFLDYNGDGHFTRPLDAYALVEVVNAPQNENAPAPKGPLPPAKSPTAWQASDTVVSTNSRQSELGQEVIVAATVTHSIANAGQPTGWVSFFDQGEYLGHAPLDDAGTASFATTDLGPGEHTIVAIYTGDETFHGSAGTTIHWVISSEVVDVLPPYEPASEEWHKSIEERYHASGDPPLEWDDDKLTKYEDQWTKYEAQLTWYEDQLGGTTETDAFWDLGSNYRRLSENPSSHFGTWRLPGMDDHDRVREQSADSYIDPWPETQSGFLPWYETEYLLNLSESETKLESSNRDTVLANMFEDQRLIQSIYHVE